MPKQTNGGKHAWTDASVEFFSDEEQGLCLVSMPQLKFLPRIGETVMLPDSDDESKTLYEVELSQRQNVSTLSI